MTSSTNLISSSDLHRQELSIDHIKHHDLPSFLQSHCVFVFDLFLALRTAGHTPLSGTSTNIAAMTATPSNDAALQGNYDVDYVIRYTFGGGQLKLFSFINSKLIYIFQWCRPSRSKRAA